jgi:hypothetical protein
VGRREEGDLLRKKRDEEEEGEGEGWERRHYGGRKRRELTTKEERGVAVPHFPSSPFFF